MADAGVIREFLVGLGWKINKSSQRDFEEALDTSKKAALALTASLTGVVAAVSAVAQSYERLEYAAQIAKSSVAGMQQFAFSISQVGGDADAARGSLQAMGNFLRSTPGGEGFIRRLGVQTRDANGALRDTSDIMGDLASRFRNMPYWRARATAGMLGIDENTLQAMIRGVGTFGRQYTNIYKRMGVDQNAAAKASVSFMQQLRLLGATFGALKDKVALSLERGVMEDMSRFRDVMVSHSDQISGAISKIARFVTVLGAALMQLFSRASEILSSLVNWFDTLDRSTKIWIETLGALLVAWRLLNRGFLATPIGRVVALGTAILALYDDYKTWQAGGKSLIDWKAWKPSIDAAIDAIKQVKTLLADVWPDVEPSFKAMTNFFKHALIDSLKSTAQAIGFIARAMDDILHGNFRAAWGEVKAAASQGMGNLKDLGQSAAAVGSALAGSLTGLDSGRINTAMQYLQSQGIDRVHAAAIIGNWQQESGLGTNMGTGSHRGLEQWDAHRQAAIMSGTGIDVRNAGFADQMRAALWELRNGEEKGHFQNFMRTTRLDEAAGYFAQNIERSGEKPGDLGFDKRIAYAHGANVIGGFGNAAGAQAPIIHQNVTVTGATNPQAVADTVVRATHDAVNTAYRNFVPRRQ